MIRLFTVYVLLMSCLAPRLPGETIVFLGDSITAGYGLDESQAYPALIQNAVVTASSAWKIVNAGVSGDTTAGGVRRVTWLLKSKPEIVVVALGANDGLRGVPVSQITANLKKIITSIRAAGAIPVLAGMQLPTNYGEQYRVQFSAVWPDLAAASEVSLVPFLLAGVAGERALNQVDGIHPTAAGQRIIAQNLLSFLTPLMKLKATPILP